MTPLSFSRNGPSPAYLELNIRCPLSTCRVCARERASCAENANAPRVRVPVCVSVREGVRGYPRRIKGRAETRLKNHDPCVRTMRARPSLSFSSSSFGFLLVLPLTSSARGFKSASTHPKQPDFLLRAPVCGDDILFRACYANRELSSAGERPRDECRVSTLDRSRKITVIDFAKINLDYVTHPPSSPPPPYYACDTFRSFKVIF